MIWIPISPVMWIQFDQSGGTPIPVVAIGGIAIVQAETRIFVVER